MSGNKQQKDRVRTDASVVGGESLRGVDRWASETFGGSRHGGNGVYANYVEPTLHAAEHARRSVQMDGLLPTVNKAEWNRAKDELKHVGKGGLVAMENTRVSGGECYQNGNVKKK